MAIKQRILDVVLLIFFPHVCLCFWLTERISPSLSALLAIAYAGFIAYFLFIDQPAFYYQLTQFWLLVITAYAALPGLFFMARGFDSI